MKAAVPSNEIGKPQDQENQTKMHADDEYEDKRSIDWCGDIVAEYRARYAALGPRQKHEADVRRASKLFDLYLGSETFPPEIERQFIEWFARYGDRPHVEAAFVRYLEQDSSAADAGQSGTIPEKTAENKP